MYEITIAIMSVFAVLGVMNIIHSVCEFLLRKKADSIITIYIETDAVALESEARALLFKNPTAEIVIKDKGGECREVAERLKRETPRIHFEQ